MVQVTITIEASTTTDVWTRFHGKAIDEALDRRFWETQPGSVIGTRAGSISHSQTVNLSEGEHVVEYGVSAFVGEWVAQIVVDGEVVAQGLVTVNQHLIAAFTVGVPPEDGEDGEVKKGVPAIAAAALIAVPVAAIAAVVIKKKRRG